MNIFARLWFWLTKPFRLIGAEPGALTCRTCGAVVMSCAEHRDAMLEAHAVGALLGWRCDNCGERGGFGT